MDVRDASISRVTLALVALCSAAALVACTPEEPPPVTGQFNSNAETGHQVTVSQFSFVPRTITIAPGEKIRWINTDNAIHQLTGEGDISSPPLGLGEVYVNTFDEVGDYPYSCSVHPAETGTVYVRQ